MSRGIVKTVRRSVLLIVPSTLMLVLLITGNSAKKLRAQSPEQIPPPGQSNYVGMTKCAACHYKQYEDWKSTPHAKAFDYLPAKYRNDAQCLECHTSRHGREAAGQVIANNLPGVSCEDCHGPGRDHANLALSYLGQTASLNQGPATDRTRFERYDRELTDEAVEKIRLLIQKTGVGQCFKCHTSKAHKPHPKFDRDELTPRAEQLNAGQKRSFFQVHQ